MSDEDEVKKGYIENAGISLTIRDVEVNIPCVVMEFEEVGWVAMPYPDEIDGLADGLHEIAEALRIEIRRRGSGLN